MPTIPHMGLSSAVAKEGAPLETADSAIFADAEEESPRPERRPSAPLVSELRRRKSTLVNERFDDADGENSALDVTGKVPSTTAKLLLLSSLASGDETKSPAQRTPAAQIMEPKLGSKRVMRAPTTETTADAEGQQNTNSQREVVWSSEVGYEKLIMPSISAEEDGNIVGEENSGEVVLSHRPRVELESTPNIVDAQRSGFLAPLKMSSLQMMENAITFSRRVRSETFPRFTQRARNAFVVILSYIPCFFNLMQLVVTLPIKLMKTQAKNERRELTNCKNQGACPTNEQSKGSNENFKLSGKCTGPDKSMALFTVDDLETIPATVEPVEVRTVAEDDNALANSASRSTEDVMTAIPRVSFTKEDKEKSREHENVMEDPLEQSNVVSDSFSIDGQDCQAQGATPSRMGLPADGSSSGASPSNVSHYRDSEDDILQDLDQSSMRFERKASEVILSPLLVATPTFASDCEFDVEHQDAHTARNQHEEVGISARPQRQSIERNLRNILPVRKRSSRVPTGKLKTDVKTMKDSLFRVFGRGKAEPETRFASPRSARKTLALVADMLVKEHGCDVAVRRNGALKMRCEKIFYGNQRLKVRFAFQAMDAFSCNVIVCRSREDDLQISTTDYVAFVADLQRSFLNSTSEGIHRTGSN